MQANLGNKQKSCLKTSECLFRRKLSHEDHQKMLNVLVMGTFGTMM